MLSLASRVLAAHTKELGVELGRLVDACAQSWEAALVACGRACSGGAASRFVRAKRARGPSVVFAAVVSVLGTAVLGSAMTGSAAQASASAGVSSRACTSGRVPGSCGDPLILARARSIAVEDHPVVTPAQAEQVVASYVSAINVATTAAANNAVEGPPLSVLDDANVGVASSSAPMFTTTNVRVFVPMQTTYPAQFLALGAVTQSGSMISAFLVFTKRSVGAPWKAVYVTPASPPSSDLVQRSFAPTIFVDANGYARTVNGASGLSVEPATLPHTLAAYFQQSLKANHPAPSKIFDRSLSGYLLSLVNANTANRDTVTAAPTIFPVYSYRTANGGALSFVTLRFHLHAVPAGTATTVNPTAIFQLLGQVPGLTQGQHYRSIDIDLLALLALTVPREPTQRPDVRRRYRSRRDLGKRHTRVAERPAGHRHGRKVVGYSGPAARVSGSRFRGVPRSGAASVLPLLLVWAFVVALTGHYSNPSKEHELPTLLRLVRALLDSADDIAELLRRLGD